MGETRRGLPYSLWGLADQSGLPGCLVWSVGHWRTPVYRSSSLKFGRYTTRARCRDPPPQGRSSPERTRAIPQPSTRSRDRSRDHPHLSGTHPNHPGRGGSLFAAFTSLICTQTYRLTSKLRCLSGAHSRGVPRAATRRHSRSAALWPARAGAGAGPAPSPARLAASMARQPSVTAVTAAAATAVEATVDRRALLVTSAAEDRPAGGEVDGGDHWRDLLDLGPPERVAGRRDAPVEVRQKWAKASQIGSVGRREARGQARGCMHAHGARALEMGASDNGEGLTSGCRPEFRTGRSS